MANEPKAPAQSHRSDERAENCDKDREIELYYELLSSGHSVGEILNGACPARGQPELGETATEQPQSQRDSERTDPAAEVALDSQPPVTGFDGAYASGMRHAADDSGDRERFWSHRLPTMAASIGFWALYTGAIASASIAGFSLLHAGRDTSSSMPLVRSGMLHAEEAAAAPGRAEGPPAIPAEGVAPSLAGPGAVPPVAATVSADRLDAEAARPLNTADPDAIEQLVERLIGPVEAPAAAAASAPPVVQFPPYPAAEAAGKATSTVAPSPAATARPSRTHSANSRHAYAPRREARWRQPVGRRNPAGYPRAADYTVGRGPVGAGRGAGAYDTDIARGYGRGAYGPSPYSELGN